MVTFFDEMALWVARQESPDQQGVKITHRAGADAPKPWSDVGFESEHALGVVAVWGTGELEAEVVEIATERRLFVMSSIADDPVQLKAVLDRVLWDVRQATP